jgi:hypothetical protein
MSNGGDAEVRGPEAGAQDGDGTRIVLEVVEGPMDGARLAGRHEEVTIGRASANDLALLADASVSSVHAVLEATPDPTIWRINDRSSTNGTWIAGQEISVAQDLPVGSEFMTGTSVIRMSRSPGATSYLPTDETLGEEAARVAASLTAEAASGYGAALATTVQEGRSFMTERDLVLGLLIATPESLGLSDADGSLSVGLLAKVLRRNAYWTEERAWINDLIGELRQGTRRAGPVKVKPTPRLLSCLLAAEEDAGGPGAGAIEPAHLLRAVLGSPSSRVRQLLNVEEIDADELMAAVEQVPLGRRISPAPRSTAVVSSGDPAIDLRAQEAARRLAGKAASYQLAEPAERRSAIKDLLLEEVGRLAPERRRLLLEQLGRQFPVSSAEQSAELTRLERELASLQQRLAEEDARSAKADGGPEVDCERELTLFAQRIERLISGVVSNLTGSSGVLGGLPGSAVSIDKAVKASGGEEQVSLEDLRRHVRALELWFMAALSAYHEAPQAWFKKFWNRIAPSRIEKRLSEVGWKKKLGIQSLDLWDAYLEEVKDVSPELAEDEIERLVRSRAQRKFERLMEEMAGPKGEESDA